MKKSIQRLLILILVFSLLCPTCAFATGEGATPKYNVYDYITLRHVKKPVATESSVTFKWKMTIKDIAQDVFEVGVKVLQGSTIMGRWAYPVEPGALTSLTVEHVSSFTNLPEGLEYSYSFYARVVGHGQCWMGSGKFTTKPDPSPTPAPTKPTSIQIDPSSAQTLNVGDKLQLDVVFTPDDAASALKWKSSAPKKAAVDQTGLVTALKAGKARISVKTANKKKASVVITIVDPNKPTAVTLDQHEITLAIGETAQLHAALEPITATGALTWKSSAPKRATVDSSGFVTAVASGEAVITVKTDNGFKDLCLVRIP